MIFFIKKKTYKEIPQGISILKGEKEESQKMIKQMKYINLHNAIIQRLLYFVIKTSEMTGTRKKQRGCEKTPSPSYTKPDLKSPQPPILRVIPIRPISMILRCFRRRKRESITTTAAGSCFRESLTGKHSVEHSAVV